MRRSQHLGNRYLAGLVMIFAIIFFVLGTFGPAHRSPYYWLIVPPPALAAFALSWGAWRSSERSTVYSAVALLLLLAVLGFSHLLPRSHG